MRGGYPALLGPVSELNRVMCASRVAALVFFLALASCGTLNEEIRPVPSPVAAQTVVVPRRHDRSPVAVSEQEFQVAMRVLLAEVRLPVRFGARPGKLEVLPANWEPA